MGTLTRSRDARQLAPYRQDQILQLLTQRKGVTVAELARRFQVTPTTIRRDLAALEARGLLQRAHGGAVVGLSALAPDPSIDERVGLYAAEKERIGAAAAGRVAEGQTVILDAGTTTLAVARHLVHRAGITVVTISIGILALLAPRREITTICVGGLVAPRAGALYGHLAEQTLREIMADQVFLSAGGITTEHGITVPALELVPIKQTMVACGRRIIVVADRSKLGRRSVHMVCPLDAIQEVITDRDAAPEVVAALRARGVAVTLV
jgi:DeoR family fructose operon transcriptional repressor